MSCFISPRRSVADYAERLQSHISPHVTADVRGVCHSIQVAVEKHWIL